MKTLVVVIDALRPDFLSCYGHPYSNISKGIDFHAGRGSVFLQAHGGCNTPHSTAMFLTGRRDYDVDEWKITLKGTKPTLLDLFPNYYLYSANLIPRDLFLEAGAKKERCIAQTVPGYVLTNDAIRHMTDNLSSSDDWFYMMWYMDVHEYERLDIAKYPHAKTTLEGKRTDADVALDEALLEDYKDILRHSQYSCAVRYVDICIQRFVNKLQNQHDIEYDWLVIMADHGEYLTPYYTHGRHWQYQITHIPLIFRGNGTTRRNTITTRFDLCDVAATLVDLSGQKIPKEWQGVSFKEHLRMREVGEE